MFVDTNKAHPNARCDQEEWVELLEELCRYGKRQIENVVARHVKGTIDVGGGTDDA